MSSSNPHQAHDAAEIERHVRTYLAVFFGLMGLTVATVIASYLHLAIPIAVSVALLIATVKGGMVASFFMHLISEKRGIYAVLILTGVFFLALMFLPLLTYLDRVTYP